MHHNIYSVSYIHTVQLYLYARLQARVTYNIHAFITVHMQHTVHTALCGRESYTILLQCFIAVQ